MKYFVGSFLAFFVFITPCLSSSGKIIPTFPGAEGFGALSTGGRGGKVIKVTNLNSNGPGSLSAACNTPGKRIIVFDVAGVIRGDVEITYSDITIAGQTAPDPGITIEGRLIANPKTIEKLRNIVVRFIRFRPPPIKGHDGDVIQLPKSEYIILDHLSLAWGNDEIIDIIHSSNVTIQWCTVEESDPEGHGKGVPHNYALLSAYPGSGNVSIHHNLFAHHARRIPSLTPYVKNKPADFRNNVIYNFREGLGHDGHVPVAGINIIGNYFKRGPNSKRIVPFAFSEKGKYYLQDNFIEGIGYLNNEFSGNIIDRIWVKFDDKGEKVHRPFSVPSVTTQPVKTAYQKVLMEAGSFPRDRITRRTINEVKNNTGEWARNAPINPDDDWYLQGLNSEEAPVDTDSDGIPDNWEIEMGLNKNDKQDYGNYMNTGYTAIEEYINRKAEQLIQNNKRVTN